MVDPDVYLAFADQRARPSNDSLSRVVLRGRGESSTWVAAQGISLWNCRGAGRTR